MNLQSRPEFNSEMGEMGGRRERGVPTKQLMHSDEFVKNPGAKQENTQIVSAYSSHSNAGNRVVRFFLFSHQFSFYSI